jgi:hypothetical protein
MLATGPHQLCAGSRFQTSRLTMWRESSRRDFPKEQFDFVMAVLHRYESKRERPRVQLATLKLANGDLDALQKQIGTALEDFRDVLAPAEYPEYSKQGPRVRRGLPAEEKQRILDSDWEQYEAWLRRKGIRASPP